MTAIVAVMLLALPLRAQEVRKVVVTGGPDATGQGYEWIVANQYDSPIVVVEIPHYHGTIFTADDGWTTDCTGLVGVGVSEGPGVCTAKANSPRYGILHQRTGTFRLNLAARGARPGAGDVTVTFADGSTAVAAGVPVPVAESFLERYSALLGLALVGLVVILIGGRRGRSKQPAPAATADPKDGA